MKPDEWAYQLALGAYKAGVYAASIFGNEKASDWVSGRRDTWKILEGLKQGKIAWVHCASLGEYELALPIIEKLHSDGFRIVLSFFSSSGYNVVKPHASAYAACVLLPTDSAKNAERWFDAIMPSVYILSKGDTWYYYLCEAKKRNIPSLLISARFLPRHMQGFAGYWNKKVLPIIDAIGVQDEDSVALLIGNGIENVYHTGDVRFDRVQDNARQAFQNPIIENFCADQKVLIAGSTWPQDEEVLLAVFPVLKAHGCKMIIAPHELNENHLKNLETSFGALRLSNAAAENVDTTEVLLIDKIGILKYLYRYGHVAFIGGAFKQGLHNILEPAAYGIPVIFGPETNGFPEADVMTKVGGAFSIANAAGLEKVLVSLISNETAQNEAGNSALSFIQSGSGAAERTWEMIRKRVYGQK